MIDRRHDGRRGRYGQPDISLEQVLAKGSRVSRASPAASDENLRLLRSNGGHQICDLSAKKPLLALQNRWNLDRKSTRLNSSHLGISYAVFCLKKKKDNQQKITNLNSEKALNK